MTATIKQFNRYQYLHRGQRLPVLPQQAVLAWPLMVEGHTSLLFHLFHQVTGVADIIHKELNCNKYSPITSSWSDTCPPIWRTTCPHMLMFLSGRLVLKGRIFFYSHSLWRVLSQVARWTLPERHPYLSWEKLVSFILHTEKHNDL